MKQVGTVKIKPGRERSLRNRHPWLFSGMIAEFDLPHNGALARVLDSKGELYGHGYFNRNNSLAGRMISWGQKPPLEAFRENIEKAISMRSRLFDGKNTTGFRIINAEGDNLPGLIVDRYDTTLVMQIGSLGMELLKPELLEILKSCTDARSIFERSDSGSRKLDGLEPHHGFLFGQESDRVDFLENNFTFTADIKGGQKTGFFLDQREMRAFLESIAAGRTILNCFGYSGAFSCYGLRGGALRLCTVDSSAAALELAAQHLKKNNLDDSKHEAVCADAFEFLRNSRVKSFDLIILDPPAFVKTKHTLQQGLNGYREINRQALKSLPSGGILLTFSCSHYVSREDFQRMLFMAAREADRDLRIIQEHRFALDHPISLFHPEGSYLKGMVLEVR
jgi:23S rRNA (cytosine1962-C5)-methyltransferase